MADFRIGATDFELDGRPVRLLSGAVHYFRVPEAHWRHRLDMLRAMGLNCVETYAAWNLHEPRPGEYTDVDALGRFLDVAREAGLWAIVRPGPYICAEWENGGLPDWVTGPLGPRIRTSDGEYLRLVDGWFDRLLPQVVHRQIDRGGPVLLVQVENEYGSYGSDAAYLRHLADGLRARGVTVPLCTSDGPEDHMLTGGSIPGVLATANFGSDATGAFATLRRHQPTGPLLCMEFWCGWFTHWGEDPIVRDAADAAGALREILDHGASVNVYMAHGGTNFAGWAGANRGGSRHDGVLQPTATSYDYDAPIDEFGRPTAKFHAFREVLAPYADAPLPDIPTAPPSLSAPIPSVLTEHAALSTVLDTLGGKETESLHPPTFEQLGVDRGLVVYDLDVPAPRQPYPLRLNGLRDRATVYVDGVKQSEVDTEDTVIGDLPGGVHLQLWVESLGRVNYGPRLSEPKGITNGILHERQYLHGIRARPLRLDALNDADAVAEIAFHPTDPDATTGLYRGVIDVPEPGDAVLALPGWTRGFVWINGVNLGRYWNVGPQRTLYVPGPFLKPGPNTILILELAHTDARSVELSPLPA